MVKDPALTLVNELTLCLRRRIGLVSCGTCFYEASLGIRVDCSLMVTFQFRWPLQVAFDTMIENVPHNNHFLSPLHSLQRLYACVMAAVLFFVACTITYHVASRFVSDWTAEKRVSFCSNAVGTLNSIVSTPLSLFALYDILSPMVPTIDCRTASAGEVNLAMVTSSLTIVITTGAVCGQAPISAPHHLLGRMAVLRPCRSECLFCGPATNNGAL